jgi:hypothetical protein
LSKYLSSIHGAVSNHDRQLQWQVRDYHWAYINCDRISSSTYSLLIAFVQAKDAKAELKKMINKLPENQTKKASEKHSEAIVDRGVNEFRRI